MDLGSAKMVTAIVTQGRAVGNWDEQHVTSYAVAVSIDGENFTTVAGTFTNDWGDKRTVSLLPTVVIARYIRLTALTWQVHVDMRAGAMVVPVGECLVDSWCVSVCVCGGGRILTRTPVTLVRLWSALCHRLADFSLDSKEGKDKFFAKLQSVQRYMTELANNRSDAANATCKTVTGGHHVPFDNVPGEFTRTIGTIVQCMERCVLAEECAHWAFWPDGGCHLATNTSVWAVHEALISGDGNCYGKLTVTVAPTHNDLLKVVDMAKLEVLYLYGGIVMDADQDCLKRLTPLLGYGTVADWVGVFENERVGDMVANGVQLAHQFSPSVRRALAQINHLLPRSSAAWATTGPCLVSEAIAFRCFSVPRDRKQCDPLRLPVSCAAYPPEPILVLPSETFYPYHHSDVSSMPNCEIPIRNAYTLQHWSSTHEAYSHNDTHTPGTLRHGVEWTLDESTAEYVGRWDDPKCLGNGGFALPVPVEAWQLNSSVRHRRAIAAGDRINLVAPAAEQVRRLEACSSRSIDRYPRSCIDLQTVSNRVVEGRRVQTYPPLTVAVEMVVLHGAAAKVRVTSSHRKQFRG